MNTRTFIGISVLTVLAVIGIVVWGTHQERTKSEATPFKNVKVTEWPANSVAKADKEYLAARITLARPELFEKESELVKDFGLASDDGLGTARLYWQKREGSEITYAPLSDRGLSISIPHDRSYGFPYYELTPFDTVDGEIWYGDINPCPAGCSGTRGVLRGKIKFHPAGSSSRIMDEFLAAYGGDGSCKSVAVNKNTRGIYCFAELGHMIAPSVIIEGTKYTYEIKDQQCRLYDEKEVEVCATVANSISVE